MRRTRFVLVSIIVLCCFAGHLAGQREYRVEGWIYGIDNNPLIGATVYDSVSQKGVVTNEQGYFNIQLKEGKHHLRVSYVGYDISYRSLVLTKDIRIKMGLKPVRFNEVVVTAKQRDHFKINAARKPLSLSLQEIEEIPSIIGEPDVLKALTILPGIAQISEVSTGLTIRGAPHDQNLIVLDEAPHYQPGHLFGFTSVFNYDAIRKVRVYKNIVPVRYGGKLSGVIELFTKNGNPDSLDKSYTFGLINSSATWGGPLSKKKNISYFVSGRALYLSVLSLPLWIAYKNNAIDSYGGYLMYDLNANVKWNPSEFNEWSFHIFSGTDRIHSKNKDHFLSLEDRIEFQAVLDWGTHNASLRNKYRLPDNKTFVKSHITFSNSFLRSRFKSVNLIDNTLNYFNNRTSKLQEIGLGSYLNHFAVQHESNAGVEATIDHIVPRLSEIRESEKVDSYTTENGFNYFTINPFVDDLWSFHERFSLYMGLRWSNYFTEGYYSNQIEPRISLHYSSVLPFGVSIGYQRMAQYSFLAPITNLGLPNDVWLAVKDELLPSKMDQFFVQYDFDPQKYPFHLELDLFYRKYDQLTEIKNRVAYLFGVPYKWEKNIENDGKGTSYGLECRMSYEYGRFQGSSNYTFLRVLNKFSSINNGMWYPGQYDIRHQLTQTLSIKISKQWRFNGNFIINSGRPVTLPKEIVKGNDGDEFIIFGSKNAGRLSPYHRLDVGFLRKYKTKKGREATLRLSVYNTYYHKNPFYYDYTRYRHDEDGKIIPIVPFMSQLSLLPIIPSISYSLKM